MAKSKKKPAKKPTKKAAKKATKKAAPKARRPRQPRLIDDMPKVRALDHICERLSGVREDKNELVAEEKGLIQNALAQMQHHDVRRYKAHGIELFRVQGDEKVRVRLVDDDNGDADDNPPAVDPEAGDVLDDATDD